jgi:hypothetical protein
MRDSLKTPGMDITKIWKKMGKYAACARELWTG